MPNTYSNNHSGDGHTSDQNGSSTLAIKQGGSQAQVHGTWDKTSLIRPFERPKRTMPAYNVVPPGVSTDSNQNQFHNSGAPAQAQQAAQPQTISSYAEALHVKSRLLTEKANRAIRYNIDFPPTDQGQQVLVRKLVDSMESTRIAAD